MKRLHARLAGDPVARQRLAREADALRRLGHLPGVVRLRDEKTAGRRPFLILELLGESLEQRLKRGRIPSALVLRWTAQLADTLDAAHAMGVVHRDIAPANLLLTNDGRRLKLADLGIARQRGDVQLTAPHLVVGTLRYMAPEQARGQATTGRTDQFALAATIFEALVGRPPWPTSPALAVGAPPPSGLSPAVDEVFARALARMPQARYATCGAFAQALERAVRPASSHGSRRRHPRDRSRTPRPAPQRRTTPGPPPIQRTAQTQLLRAERDSRTREVTDGQNSMRMRVRRDITELTRTLHAAVTVLGVLALIVLVVAAARLVAAL